MNILSLYPHPFSVGWNHDTSASIITESGKVFSQEEAKFSQHNYDYQSRYAELSMAAGFKELAIEPTDIDIFVTGQPFGVDSHEVFTFLSRILKVDIKLGENLVFCPHSLAHAYQGFYTSPFEESDVLVIDGGGDEADRTSLLHLRMQRGAPPRIIRRIRDCHLALFHNLVTEMCGFGQFENGKTTGLASYAAGRDLEELETAFNQTILEDNPNTFLIDILFEKSPYNIQSFNAQSYKRWKTYNTYGYGLKERLSIQNYPPDYIAAAGQSIFDRELLRIVRENVIGDSEFTGNLVGVGGIFQNVVSNSHIRTMCQLEGKFFVPNACNDSGLSLGQALYALCTKHSSPCIPLNITPYTGYSASQDSVDVCSEYERSGVIKAYQTQASCPYEQVASLLNDGFIIGVYSSSCELGPRSLGSRSVIASPRSKSNKHRLNRLLKKRDWFMPFAPSILSDFADTLIVNYDPLTKYMTEVVSASSLAKETIPCAVHVDGTMRPHIVYKEESPAYYWLINSFYNLTGVPCVLNTSFNRHGIPTINSPQQAIDHLMCGNIDCLFMNDTIYFPSGVEHQGIFKEKPDTLYSELEDSLYCFAMHIEFIAARLKTGQVFQNETMSLWLTILLNDCRELASRICGRLPVTPSASLAHSEGIVLTFASDRHCKTLVVKEISLAQSQIVEMLWANLSSLDT